LEHPVFLLVHNGQFAVRKNNISYIV